MIEVRDAAERTLPLHSSQLRLLVPPLLGAHRDAILSFLNHLAFAQGMQPVYQCGAFIGPVRKYAFGGLRAQSSPDPDEQDRGGAGGSV